MEQEDLSATTRSKNIVNDRRPQLPWIPANVVTSNSLDMHFSLDFGGCNRYIETTFCVCRMAGTIQTARFETWMGNTENKPQKWEGSSRGKSAE